MSCFKRTATDNGFAVAHVIPVCPARSAHPLFFEWVEDPVPFWGKWEIGYPFHPRDWYIYLHEWLIFMVNVGKYTSPMDAMGCVTLMRFFLLTCQLIHDIIIWLFYLWFWMILNPFVEFPSKWCRFHLVSRVSFLSFHIRCCYFRRRWNVPNVPMLQCPMHSGNQSFCDIPRSKVKEKIKCISNCSMENKSTNLECAPDPVPFEANLLKCYFWRYEYSMQNWSIRGINPLNE